MNEPEQLKTNKDVDVVVVGAGLSGLVAACRLSAAGISVLVLEAAAEVGGRTRSRVCGGRIVDLGGELVGRSYTKLRKLVSELGLHLEPNPSPYRLRLSPGPRPSLNPIALFRFGRALLALGKLARSLPEHEPWSAECAGDLDALSVADWLEQRGVAQREIRLFESLALTFTTVPLNRLSLLHLLVWLRPAGGVSALWRDTRWRIREGAQEVCKRMAARLGGKVVLEASVSHIEQTPEHVIASTNDGRSWRCRRLILAVPFATTGDIAFDPELPRQQVSMFTDISVSAITKVVLVPAGRPSSFLAIGDPTLPVAYRDPYHAYSFAYGADADRSPDLLYKKLAQLVGISPSEIDGSVFCAWGTEPFAGGGYVAFSPGQLTRHGPALRATVDRLHIGGGDQSLWPGTMEGAVADGERLAEQMLKQLNQQQNSGNERCPVLGID